MGAGIQAARARVETCRRLRNAPHLARLPAVAESAAPQRGSARARQDRAGDPVFRAARSVGQRWGHADAVRFVHELASKHWTAQAIVADWLTPREEEVASLLGQGLSNKQIAVQLAVSVGTVRAHVDHILGKLRIALAHPGRGVGLGRTGQSACKMGRAGPESAIGRLASVQAVFGIVPPAGWRTVAPADARYREGGG